MRFQFISLVIVPIVSLSAMPVRSFHSDQEEARFIQVGYDVLSTGQGQKLTEHAISTKHTVVQMTLALTARSRELECKFRFAYMHFLPLPVPFDTHQESKVVAIQNTSHCEKELPQEIPQMVKELYLFHFIGKGVMSQALHVGCEETTILLKCSA
eukprot:scpid89070/ scgid16031/ 